MNRSVISTVGRGRINSNPDLKELLDNFLRWPTDFDAQIEESTTIGRGNYATVHAFGDTAIKLCRADQEQEDLHVQFNFMSRLHDHLAEGRQGVITPAYYFEMHNRRGDRILGCERMEEWQTVYQWLHDNDPHAPKDQLDTISGVIRRRVRTAIRAPHLRLGVNDLASESLNGAHNVMVPVDSLDPTTAPLCVIDQPKSHFLRDESVFGYITARALTAVAPI